VSAGEPVLLVTGTAEATKRDLGPLAWWVLGDLLLGADRGAAELFARTNARRVAAELGVDKGTAARALRVLDSAGLVQWGPQGRAGGSDRASTGYGNQRTSRSTGARPGPTTPNTAPAAHPGRRHRPANQPSQLTLISDGSGEQ
jgi:hypothetical protein